MLSQSPGAVLKVEPVKYSDLLLQNQLFPVSWYLPLAAQDMDNLQLQSSSSSHVMLNRLHEHCRYHCIIAISPRALLEGQEADYETRLWSHGHGTKCGDHYPYTVLTCEGKWIDPHH
jgi:hypothetical protein